LERRLFVTTSPTATQHLAQKIGEKLRPGSIVALIGELGCGKTCFTKGLCAGLDIPSRRVNSPTFAFVNEYEGRLPVFHLDLYRVENIATSLEIGILDYLAKAKSGVVVIEWAERVLPLLSNSYLQANFSVLSPKKRQIVLVGFGEEFCKLLGELGE